MVKYVMTGDPIPPEFTTAAGINRLLERIAELETALRHYADPETWKNEPYDHSSVAQAVLHLDGSSG